MKAVGSYVAVGPNNDMLCKQGTKFTLSNDINSVIIAPHAKLTQIIKNCLPRVHSHKPFRIIPYDDLIKEIKAKEESKDKSTFENNDVDNQEKIISIKSNGDIISDKSDSNETTYISSTTDDEHEKTPTDTKYKQYSTDEIYRIVKDAVELFASLPFEQKRLSGELSVVEESISDIIHYYELLELSASDKIKLSDMLSKLRRQRRDIKDKLNVIHVINTQNIKGIRAGTILECINRIFEREYRPRRLTPNDVLGTCDIKVLKDG